MKINVTHTFPCGFKIEYILFSFFGFYGYTKAKNTQKCRIHGFRCKTIVSPIDEEKEEWRSS